MGWPVLFEGGGTARLMCDAAVLAAGHTNPVPGSRSIDVIGRAIPPKPKRFIQNTRTNLTC